jgi:hypothetical protein
MVARDWGITEVNAHTPVPAHTHTPHPSRRALSLTHTHTHTPQSQVVNAEALEAEEGQEQLIQGDNEFVVRNQLDNCRVYSSECPSVCVCLSLCLSMCVCVCVCVPE